MYTRVTTKGATESPPLVGGSQLLPLGVHRLGFVPSAPGGGDSGRRGGRAGAGRKSGGEEGPALWALC